MLLFIHVLGAQATNFICDGPDIDYTCSQYPGNQFHGILGAFYFEFFM
jgi:hypothetical protein